MGPELRCVEQATQGGWNFDAVGGRRRGSRGRFRRLEIQDRQETLARERARSQEEYDDLEKQWRSAMAAADGHYVTNPEYAAIAEDLSDEMSPIWDELEWIDAEWPGLVRKREIADSDFIAALNSRDVRGSLSSLVKAGTELTSEDLLLALATMSPAELRALSAAHPDLLDRLRRATPEEVAPWWAGMPADQQDALITSMPAVVGALGGVPAVARVAANRLVAAEQLKALREELRKVEERGAGGYDPNMPYAPQAAAAAYLQKSKALETEIEFLERVVSGDARLYLYDRAGGKVIEVFGDPATADVVMSFMPGTNTSMESFYDRDGLTAFTRWQVENATPGVDVAGFVVMQGEFPHLENLLTEGPQNRWYSDVLGRRYANFAREVDVITGGTPLVSVEHSFGSAVAGVAEDMGGADFDARYMLAGIGMHNGWEPKDGTEYYAAQGLADINHYFEGKQLWGLGYGVTPTESNGIDERYSGFGLPDTWPSSLSTPTLVAEYASTALEQHNGIISADLSENRFVLNDVRSKLEEAAQ